MNVHISTSVTALDTELCWLSDAPKLYRRDIGCLALFYLLIISFRRFTAQLNEFQLVPSLTSLDTDLYSLSDAQKLYIRDIGCLVFEEECDGSNDYILAHDTGVFFSLQYITAHRASRKS